MNARRVEGAAREDGAGRAVEDDERVGVHRRHGELGPRPLHALRLAAELGDAAVHERPGFHVEEAHVGGERRGRRERDLERADDRRRRAGAQRHAERSIGRIERDDEERVLAVARDEGRLAVGVG